MLQRVLQYFARKILRNEINALRSQLEQASYDLSKAQATAQEVRYGLHKDIFRKKVVEKLEQPMINNSTTEHQVGYLLGIQRALSVMENEVVHD